MGAQSASTTVAELQPPPKDGSENSKTHALDPAVLKRNHICLGDARDQTVHAYRLLRTQVLHFLHEHSASTIMVTSPRQGDGKTLTAINLAIAIARDPEQSVLLVDLDLMSPSIHERLGLRADSGFRDYLEGKKRIGEVSLACDLEGLDILPGSGSSAYSSDLIRSQSMRDFLADCRNDRQGRTTIFDMPPALVSDDVLAFSSMVECSMLVVAAGKTPAPEVKRAREVVAQTHFLGVVLNGCRRSQRSKYYHHYY